MKIFTGQPIGRTKFTEVKVHIPDDRHCYAVLVDGVSADKLNEEKMRGFPGHEETWAAYVIDGEYSSIEIKLEPQSK